MAPDPSRLVEEADQVGRVNTRTRKPLQKGKDLGLGVVQIQDQVPILEAASQDTQAKVLAVEETEETAKDPKRQEVKEDIEEELLPSLKLVTKALASQALEELKAATVTVLLEVKLELARSQVQKNTELLADLERRVVTTGCRVITAGPDTSIPRPCLLCRASRTSSPPTPEKTLRTIDLCLYYSISTNSD